MAECACNPVMGRQKKVDVRRLLANQSSRISMLQVQQETLFLTKSCRRARETAQWVKVLSVQEDSYKAAHKYLYLHSLRIKYPPHPQKKYMEKKTLDVDLWHNARGVCVCVCARARKQTGIYHTYK